MFRPLTSTVPLVVTAAASSLCAQWVSVPTPASPPARFGAVLAPWQNGELLLFGGGSFLSGVSEWSWDGLRWAPVATPVPRRDFPALARNDGDGSLLLFGGLDAAGFGFADTWRFAGGNWTQLTPAASPPPTAAVMAHEPGTNSMVLVTVGVTPTQTTWRFASGSWSQVNTFTLPGSAFAMFADTVRREVCLVESGVGSLAVHRLVGTAWVEVDRRTTAPGRPLAMFDGDRGHALVLLAGTAGLESFDYDGARLVPRPAATLPLPSFFPALVYHAERKEPVLAAALGVPSFGMLRWNDGASPLATPYGAPCVASAFQLGLVPGDSPQPGAVHRLLAGGSNASALTLSVLGLSHVQNAGLPLPQTIPLGAVGCQLRVEALLADFVGIGLPAVRPVTLPNSPHLLGARYDAQFLQFDASGVTDASNGLEMQIGLPLPENVLLESFASPQRRDARASGDTWGNGAVTPVAVGGDGRHGSFDATIGTNLGGGVYQWNTDNTTIPAGITLTGNAEVVTDGRFYFTDFVVPAGITVRFVGSSPAQLFVRGQVDVHGRARGGRACLCLGSGRHRGRRLADATGRGLAQRRGGAVHRRDAHLP